MGDTSKDNPVDGRAALSGNAEYRHLDRRSLLALVYKRHWRELRHYVQKTFGEGPPEPDDVAQMAFTRLAALEAPHAIENPRAFLYTAARNIVLDYKRHEKVAHAYDTHLQHTQADNHYELSPENVSLYREQLGMMVEALKNMPEKRRTMLVLNRFEGVSYSEIARRMGMTEGAIRQNVKLALQDCLQAVGETKAQKTETSPSQKPPGTEGDRL